MYSEVKGSNCAMQSECGEMRRLYVGGAVCVYSEVKGSNCVMQSEYGEMRRCV